MQHIGIEELQTIQVELDRAPGKALEQVGEIVGQLLLGQSLDLIVKIGPDAPNRPCVGIDGLGLQPLKLEVLEMGLVIALEIGPGRCCYSVVTS